MPGISFLALQTFSLCFRHFGIFSLGFYCFIQTKIALNASLYFTHLLSYGLYRVVVVVYFLLAPKKLDTIKTNLLIYFRLGNFYSSFLSRNFVVYFKEDKLNLIYLCGNEQK